MDIKRPTVIQVADLLREKKIFKSTLNHINIGKWTDKHYEEWAIINSQAPIDKSYNERTAPFKSRKPCSHTKKVMRISDGHIFESVSECRRREDLCKSTMSFLLKEGIKYKIVAKVQN